MLKRRVPSVVPTRSLEAADSVLQKCLGAGLPQALWDLTLREILFGRAATPALPGLHGVLGMDACVVAGAVAGRDQLLAQKLVAPLLRAITQNALERGGGGAGFGGPGSNAPGGGAGGGSRRSSRPGSPEHYQQQQQQHGGAGGRQRAPSPQPMSLQEGDER